MKVLQINTVVNTGSTGRIAEDIGLVLIEKGHKSYIGYGRGHRPSKSVLIKIGHKSDVYLHGIKSAIFDRHGFGSKEPTHELISKIKQINPDVIGLHNLHGYYINIKILFNFLAKKKIPVLWTLFDCWSFTGHCSYFEDIGCERWMTGCYSCPKTNRYPASYVLDNSIKNYRDKKNIFNSLSNIQIVVHSDWLKNLVTKSYLKKIPIQVIPSGINLEVFKPQGNSVEIREKFKIGSRKVILGVANIWSKRKGLADLLILTKLLNPVNEVLVLVGLSKSQIKALPKEVVGIERTENIDELANLYSIAEVFVNPTYADNFPTTNLEALACGTPVITYNTGGSPEAVDENTGIIVEVGNTAALWKGIKKILLEGKSKYSSQCRHRAESNFDKDKSYLQYIKLYEELVSN